jgi:translation initiation factor 1 (eIF-1/SUI1)
MEQFRYVAKYQKTTSFVVINPETKHIETTQELLDRLFVGNEKVFLLKGSGFNMANQIDQWVNEFNVYDPKTKDRLVEKIMSDVTGFYHEFLSRRDIFPFDLEFRKNEKQEKIVYASKYDQPLENITDSNERDGKLLEGIKLAVELMKTAEPNTVVFLTSPDGWSGLPTGMHPDSQTYVYWISKDGNLNAMTLRTDIDLLSSEKLIGINNTINSEQARIKNVVSHPVMMRVVDDGFIEVLDEIERASDRNFDKLRDEIENRDIYKNLTGEEDREVKIIINELRLFVETEINGNDDESIRKLALAIGKSILDMQNAVNNRINKYKEQTVVVGFDSPEIKYQVLYHEVKQILGCSNGVQEQRSFGVDSKGPLEFRCHKCNGTNTRPYEGYATECRHCHATFDKCGA